jgi:hypothetical protein
MAQSKSYRRVMESHVPLESNLEIVLALQYVAAPAPSVLAAPSTSELSGWQTLHQCCLPASHAAPGPPGQAAGGRLRAHLLHTCLEGQRCTRSAHMPLLATCSRLAGAHCGGCPCTLPSCRRQPGGRRGGCELRRRALRQCTPPASPCAPVQPAGGGTAAGQRGGSVRHAVWTAVRGLHGQPGCCRGTAARLAAARLGCWRGAALLALPCHSSAGCAPSANVMPGGGMARHV